ncbi:MAG: hypothetical protein FIA99_15465 [Ruminiclostridium sp.]|nr:hypothetical protein [Ruminiclostridium sp.]
MPIAGTAAVIVLTASLYINNPFLYHLQITDPTKNQEQVIPSLQNKNELPDNSIFNSGKGKSNPNNSLANPEKKFNDLQKAPNELLDDSIAGGHLELMSDPKHPRLLITNNKTYQRILRKGDISELREYFSSKLREYRSSLEESVSRVVGG